MAGLYQRVQARGFPSHVAAGLTGAGALESQGSTADPRHGDVTPGTPGYTTQVLRQFQPDTPAPLSISIGLGFWGLPGTPVNPDQTPATVQTPMPDGSWSKGDHAAPVPGFAGSESDFDALAAMHDRSVEIHSVDFGALERRITTNEITDRKYNAWYSNDPGQNALEPVTGQLRNMAGFDATQGYGGGGTGPGGINGYGLGAPHVDRYRWSDPQPQPYLDPAERPFIAPQGGGSFIPTDAVQSKPWGSYLDGPGVIRTAPTAYNPPADPDTSSATPVAGPVSAGWW